MIETMRRICSNQTRRRPEFFFSSLAARALPPAGTMQPTFPPASEFRPPTMVVDPASAVTARDRVGWDDPITPANLVTMREVPVDCELSKGTYSGPG
jgi:hypothetical protein